jgi:hypothetical protein
MNMPKPFKQLVTLVYKASKTLKQLLYDGGFLIGLFTPPQIFEQLSHSSIKRSLPFGRLCSDQTIKTLLLWRLHPW